MVIDHTSYAVSETEGDHTLIASDDFINADVILGGKCRYIIFNELSNVSIKFSELLLSS
jgi:hypothetical protein